MVQLSKNLLFWFFIDPARKAMCSRLGPLATPASLLPFLMAFVPPFSIIRLMLYGDLLDLFGPPGALLQSTITINYDVLHYSDLCMGASRIWLCRVHLLWHPHRGIYSGTIFVVRESYAQLFVDGSVRWFGSIVGLTSIASVIAGLAV